MHFPPILARSIYQIMDAMNILGGSCKECCSIRMRFIRLEKEYGDLDLVMMYDDDGCVRLGVFGYIEIPF